MRVVCVSQAHHPPGGGFDPFDVCECLQRHTHVVYTVAEFHRRVGCDDFHGDDAELQRRLARLRAAVSRACAMRICLRVHGNSSPDRQALQLWLTDSSWILIRADRTSLDRQQILYLPDIFRIRPHFVPDLNSKMNTIYTLSIAYRKLVAAQQLAHELNSTPNDCVPGRRVLRTASIISHTHLHTCRECNSGTTKKSRKSSQ